MIGIETGRHWARQYEMKEYNGKLLHYQEPEATSEWFETAKGIYYQSWKDGVKRILGGKNAKK